ncbi:isopeptide-forming domain-containing fimbrial protein [Corynebacterium sp. YIM 101645]|uniref:Isopeptide-forming domain-containing fimbrial protein n=1 Tax=Corynebacterium lemuris TaxID=1859292 RepID=A0ABT2FZ43_9CORY|nr:isopeptide-forming domain-containing fimbrial protein [Corynebacterium lemuris]MCS5480503.1 isopeptide-forming domain-containing fimbrial protein [Corynebacterium lemuris]
MLLTALVLAMPVTAAAQERLGSVTIKKLPTSLDTPGVHPVKFEFSGGNLTAPLTLYSDSDTVLFNDLAPGTYNIRELATRTGDIARATVAPITVTVPKGDLYDVTVYPKTQPLTLRKSADVSKIIPGAKFQYTLDGTVPLPDTHDQLHRYIIRDALPSGVTLAGKSAVQLHIGSRTVPLTAGEHYNITNDNNVITATFTPTGLELLAGERGNHDDVIVRFTFGVRAFSKLAHGSQVLNIGHLYPDGYPEDGEESVVSNEHVLPVADSSGLLIPVPIPIPVGFPGSSGSSTILTPGSVGETPVISPADTPNKPGSPGAPEQPESRNPLASTGASVLGMLALGTLLSIIGITLFLRGRRA